MPECVIKRRACMWVSDRMTWIMKSQCLKGTTFLGLNTLLKSHRGLLVEQAQMLNVFVTVLILQESEKVRKTKCQ